MRMKEIWKDIKGYEGLYQVSDLGRVRSLKFGKVRVLSARKNSVGYLSVVLCKDGKKSCLIHRLVAQAFLPNPDGYGEVNHKDENPLNNVVNNIEFCDHKYNMNYGTGHERSAKARSKTVYQYTLDRSLVRSYPSTIEVERRTGYAQGNISACCNGKFKTMYGFIWSYTQFIPKGRLF